MLKKDFFFLKFRKNLLLEHPKHYIGEPAVAAGSRDI